MDEDTSTLFIFLLLILAGIWTVVIFLVNLPKVIGSLIWNGLGKFPLNVVTFYVLWCAGIILLIAGFYAIFRILDKKQKKIHE